MPSARRTEGSVPSRLRDKRSLKFGCSGEQAYMILGTAPVEGRVSGIVDIPNVCATLAIPTEIFDFDIRPNTSGPSARVSGQASPASADRP